MVAKDKVAEKPTEEVQPVEEKKNLPMGLNANKAVVDYGDDAGAGFENQTKDDVGIPFIDILQPGSPEVQDGGMPGAKAGMIINRTTGEIWDTTKTDEQFYFCPAITEHCYTEWKPRQDAQGNQLKGGFVARHELTEEICQKARTEQPFKVYKLQNGNDLIETFYTPSNIVSPNGGFAPAMLAFTSSKIKPYKAFSYIARAIMVPDGKGNMKNPPLWSHIYKITTKKKVDGTRTWYIPVIGFKVDNDAEASRLVPGEQLYESTKAMKNAFLKGEVKVDYNKTVNDTVVAEDGKPPF